MKLSEINTLNKDIPDKGYATIICNNGLCSLDSNVDIAGIQIDFNGKVEITPTLPEAWIMQGNKSKFWLSMSANSKENNAHRKVSENEGLNTKTRII